MHRRSSRIISLPHPTPTPSPATPHNNPLLTPSLQVRALPEQLALTGSPDLSVKKIAKLTGRIFLQRNEANLHSNILDCPGERRTRSPTRTA